ncbi:MAG: polymorphic toxin type 46 domain-containing protein [Blastocatellia bacterium]
MGDPFSNWREPYSRVQTGHPDAPAGGVGPGYSVLRRPLGLDQEFSRFITTAPRSELSIGMSGRQAGVAEQSIAVPASQEAARKMLSAQSSTDKLLKAAQLGIDKLPGELQELARSIFTVETLKSFVLWTAALVAANLAGFGLLADIAIFGYLAYVLGDQAGTFISEMVDFVRFASDAESDAELDRAADHFAKALVAAGAAGLTALMMRGVFSSAARRTSSPGAAATESGGRAGKPVRNKVEAKASESQAAETAASFSARMKVAREFYEKAGFSPEKTADHLKGIDFSKPVEVVTLEPPAKVIQYQRPGRSFGNYLAPPGTEASALGVNPAGRVATSYEVARPVQVLRSTAAPVEDIWSVPGEVFKADGGGIQYFTTESGAFRAVR